jgi:DNA-binding SARP family transcriptional activator
MSLLHISLFGRFDVRNGQHLLPGFEARRAQELFCYLLLYRDRPHPREVLANLLWDERSTDSPGRCLRKALWQLRSALDSQGRPLSDDMLLVESDWVQLNPDADLWLDVGDFEAAFRRVQHLEGSALDAQAVQALGAAVDLYRGGLQENWYRDWYLYERERFRHMYLSMLEKLMAHYEAFHRYPAAIEYGSRILSCERAHERTHRRLMRLYYLAGDRTAALRQYQQCTAALHEELDVGPGRSTLALYEQIRTDELAGPPLQRREIEVGLPKAASRLPLVLHSLSRLIAVLDRVQQEIREEVEALETTLRDQG